jgi:hypothetical protein
VLIQFSVRLSLYWAARFFSNQVNEALSVVRVFDCKIENAIVIDLQELREIFGNQQILASFDLCWC